VDPSVFGQRGNQTLDAQDDDRASSSEFSSWGVLRQSRTDLMTASDLPARSVQQQCTIADILEMARAKRETASRRSSPKFDQRF
jgi:hypothetical protein